MAAKLIKRIGDCGGCLPAAGWWRCAGRSELRICVAAAHAICGVSTAVTDRRSVMAMVACALRVGGLRLRAPAGRGRVGCVLDSGTQVALRRLWPRIG